MRSESKQPEIGMPFFLRAPGITATGRAADSTGADGGARGSTRVGNFLFAKGLTVYCPQLTVTEKS